MPTYPFHLRPATPDDLDAILEVCSAALDWHDPIFDRQLFEWKHLSNPFGTSLLLVAEDEIGIAAVRPLMRWRFRNGSGEAVEAARAVDTATHPRAQGKGLFRQLTEMGLEELSDPGSAPSADLIFNTPIPQSLAGYLKMGWVERGNVAFGFSFRSPVGLAKLARSRTRADKRSIEIPHVGISVQDGLALLDQQDPCPGRTTGPGALHTDHSIDSLRWRYVDAPISYRFLPGPDASGIIVRLRQRGRARELVVAQRCGEIGDASAGRAVRNAMRNSKADHCVGWTGLGATFTSAKLGPTLAVRSLSDRVPSSAWFNWQPGDIELF